MEDPFVEGRSYEADLLAQARQHARVWQRVALVAVLAAGALAAGLAFMGAQHTVSAHVVAVDRATGMAEVLSVTQMREVPLQGIEAQAWANQYVRDRERYNHGIVQVDYNSTIALSEDEVARRYDGDIRERIDRLGRTAEEQVRIKNVTLPPDQAGRAIVRFEKRLLSKDNAASWQGFIATLAYRFVPSPVGRRETLLLNPLGFKVTAYVVEPELNVDAR